MAPDQRTIGCRTNNGHAEKDISGHHRSPDAHCGCVPQAELVKLRNEMNDLRSDVKDVKGRVPDLSGIEKRQDRLEADIKGTTDLQTAIADLGARHDQLVTDLQIMQGKLEENNFRMKELSQKLDDKTYKMAELGSGSSSLRAS